MTFVDSDMRAYLDADVAPSRYRISGQIQADTEGWTAHNKKFYDFRQVFVGQEEGEHFVVFRVHAEEERKLALSMKSFVPGEEKDRAGLVKRIDELKMMCEWHGSSMQAMPKYNGKKGNLDNFWLSHIPNELGRVPKQLADDKVSNKLAAVPWAWSCEDKDLQAILDFLQADSLDKDAHIVKGVSQKITNPVSVHDRALDRQARVMAHLNVSTSCLLEPVLKGFEALTKMNLPREALETLDAMKVFTDVAAQVNLRAAPVTIKSALDFRQGLRAKSASNIRSWDVKDALQTGPLVGTGLFSEEAIDKTQEVLSHPSQRKVDMFRGGKGRGKKAWRAPSQKPATMDDVKSLLAEMQRSNAFNSGRPNSSTSRGSGNFRSHRGNEPRALPAAESSHGRGGSGRGRPFQRDVRQDEGRRYLSQPRGGGRFKSHSKRR